MTRVMYTGSPQISKRIVPLRDLGHEDSDEILVFAADNDFTLEVSDDDAEKLRAIGGFKVVAEAAEPPEEKSEDEPEEVDQAIDDHASDPEVPSSSSTSRRKKGSPQEA